MSAPPLKRDEVECAAAVMLRHCPDPQARQFLMAQLLRSIALAEQHGPQSWAVTLFAHGFRLNIGQVEAFTYLNRVVGYFMLGSIPASAYTVGEFLECSFRSMPQPQRVFYGSAMELQRLAPRLAGAHAAFVQAAATTAKGEPRRCPYSRYHSPGLYNYALQQAGALAPGRKPRAARPRRQG